MFPAYIDYSDFCALRSLVRGQLKQLLELNGAGKSNGGNGGGGAAAAPAREGISGVPSLPAELTEDSEIKMLYAEHLRDMLKLQLEIGRESRQVRTIKRMMCSSHASYHPRSYNYKLGARLNVPGVIPCCDMCQRGWYYPVVTIPGGRAWEIAAGDGAAEGRSGGPAAAGHAVPA